jgi:hypothetical protein
MEENKKSVVEPIEKMAMITDALQDLFPEGKIICVLELKKEDFKKIQGNFRTIDHTHNKFSINISGVDFVFIDESENISVEEPKTEVSKQTKTNFFKKLFSSFKGG